MDLVGLVTRGVHLTVHISLLYKSKSSGLGQMPCLFIHGVKVSQVYQLRFSAQLPLVGGYSYVS